MSECRGGSRRKPSSFSSAQRHLYSMFNTIQYLYAKIIPCDTCGCKTPGQEPGDRPTACGHVSVTCHIVGCGPAGLISPNLQKFSTHNGMSQNVASPKHCPPQPKKRKEQTPRDTPTPRARTLDTEHCEYA